MLEVQARIDNGQDPKSKQDILLSKLFKNQDDKYKSDLYIQQFWKGKHIIILDLYFINLKY